VVTSIIFVFSLSGCNEVVLTEMVEEEVEEAAEAVEKI
jgi:hypothetical protein